MAVRQFSTFSIDEFLFGLDVLLVREINRNLEITTVDLAPDYFRGLINLRGQIVPVLDIGVRLGFNKRDLTNKTCVVVLKTNLEIAQKTADPAYAGSTSNETVGIIVDRIEDMVMLDDSEIENTPANAEQIDARFISGIAKLKDRLLIMLKVNKLVLGETSIHETAK